MTNAARRSFIVGVFGLVAGLVARRPAFADDEDDDDEDDDDEDDEDGNAPRRTRFQRRRSRRRTERVERIAREHDVIPREAPRDQPDTPAPIPHPQVEGERRIIAEEQSREDWEAYKRY